MARPRGYAAWNPKPETLALVANVKEVLRTYREQGAMTIRQVFYVLVGNYGYPKDERAYGRLCEAMVRARRAELIGFHEIRDDGYKASYAAGGYESVGQFWEELRDSAGSYHRDRAENQPVRMELWCEAAGMQPMLARVAGPYGVNTYATGGFSSVSITHAIAQRALGSPLPTVFLHVGDFDPSGESIFDAMAEDAGAFVYQEGGPDFRPVRVALTAEQVEEHNLETAPPKRSDSRSANWVGETCQCEAMPPDILTRTVEGAITAEMDMEAYYEMASREDREREHVRAALEELPDLEEQE